jgi:hypothetical protein
MVSEIDTRGCGSITYRDAGGTASTAIGFFRELPCVQIEQRRKDCLGNLGRC